MGLFDKFRIGLGKSSDGLSTGFKNIFSKKKDESVLTEFEELIISSDAGVDVARELRKDFENFKIDKKLDDHKEILKLLADKMAIELLKYEKDLTLMGNANSSVIVVSGVNGVGKTTTIGKLGKYFKDNNRSVVFGAADTFRAVLSINYRCGLLKLELISLSQKLIVILPLLRSKLQNLQKKIKSILL